MTLENHHPAPKQHIYAFFILCLSPLFSPYLINPNIAPYYFIPAFALLSLLIFLCHSSRVNIRVPYLAIIFFLFSIPFIYDSHLLLFSFALASIFLMGNLLSHRNLDDAYKVFSISTGIIILISLYVWLGLNGKEALHFYGWALTTDALGVKINGPFANGNVLAIVMLCAWVISAYYWLNSEKQTQWLWLCVLLFFWIYIFLSMARGAWLAQAFMCIWFIIVLLRKKEKKKLIALIGAGILAALIGNSLLSQFQSPPPTSIAGPEQKFNSIIESSFTSRKIIWESAWNIWLNHPISGVGASQLKAHYLTSQAAVMDSFPNTHGAGATDSAHNIFLHLLAEYGVLGLVLWLLISSLLLQQTWKYKFKSNSIRWPALTSALVLWFQGHINISLTEPYPLIIFAFMLGISCRLSLRSYGMHVKHQWLLISISIVLIGLLSTGIQSTKTWYTFEKWLRMDNSHPDKGLLANKLAEDDALYPFIVSFSFPHMARTGNEKLLHQLQPMVLRALSIYQSPTLYRELFYTYVINNKFNDACQLGKFIKKQRWRSESNSEAYDRVCQGLVPDKKYYF